MQKLLDELNILPFEEQGLFPGHNACPGCGSTTALRMALESLAGISSVFFVPASCASLYFGPGLTTAAAFPVIHTLFAGAFTQAEGMSLALARRNRSEKVVIWAGDGACYDIGFGGLSGIAARNADVLVLCNNNEGFQNTGGHANSSTPSGAGEAPAPESGSRPAWRKDLMEIMAAHRAPYIATGSVAFPEDLAAKVRKAANMKGFRMILILTTCVTWRYETQLSVRLARLSVETGYHPLYEVEEGSRWRITHEPQFLPLEEFTRLQQRFRGVDLQQLKQEIDQKWADLRFRASRYA